MDSETLCEVRDVFLNDRECQYDHFELLFMSSSAQLAILAQGGGFWSGLDSQHPEGASTWCQSGARVSNQALGDQERAFPACLELS